MSLDHAAPVPRAATRSMFLTVLPSVHSFSAKDLGEPPDGTPLGVTTLTEPALLMSVRPMTTTGPSGRRIAACSKRAERRRDIGIPFEPVTRPMAGHARLEAGCA